MDSEYIIEHRFRDKSFFELVVENEYGQRQFSRSVYYPKFIVRKNLFDYIIIYDDKYNLVEDACYYLNTEIKRKSFTTRRFHAIAIRTLLAIIDLYDLDVCNFSQYALDRVISYLKNEDYRFINDKSIKTTETINLYLKAMRQFVKFVNSQHGLITQDLDWKIKIDSHKRDNVRPYISPSEFLAIRNVAVNNNDYQAVFILDLMYVFGLRIGEVLGLTEEDFIIKRPNYHPIPVIEIRNRVSDNTSQFAKNRNHPLSKVEYSKKSTSSQEVPVSMDMYTRIMKYIDAQSKRLEKEGIYDRSLADIATSSFERKDNHYIMINNYGKPLTQQAWNIRLKKYFIAANVPLDGGVKQNNLNHRLRHGCAMLYLHFMEPKASVEFVQRLLRHKWMSTTLEYMKMTVEDEILLKEQFQAYLIGKIPSLFYE